MSEFELRAVTSCDEARSGDQDLEVATMISNSAIGRRRWVT